MLQDLLRNPQETKEFIAELNEILDLAFKNDSPMFQQKDPVDSETLLFAAVKGGFYEAVKKIGKNVKKNI